MKKLKEAFKSVRVKLFLTLSISILIIILLLIIINNVVLESYYMLNKENTLKNVYNQINIYYNNQMGEDYIEAELEKISIKNNFDILIRDDKNNVSIYASTKDFYSMVGDFAYSIIHEGKNQKNILTHWK